MLFTELSSLTNQPFALQYPNMSDDRPKPPRPGSDPNLARTVLDAQLRQYLADAERDKAEGNTIAQLRLEVQDARAEQHDTNARLDEVATEQKLMRMRMDRHGKSIREIRKKVFHTDPDEIEEIDTGSHQIKDLKEYLAKHEGEQKERRDSIWWRRKRWEWVMAAAGFVAANLVLGAVALIWYLLTHR